MTDTIELTIPTSPRLRGVATLVLGGIGSRLRLPYEKVDDLQLAALSVLSASADEAVTLELAAAEDSLAVGIGPLSSGSGADDGLKRVLERLVDEFESSERDGREWLTLHLARPRSGG
jgi:hypothetical protein